MYVVEKARRPSASCSCSISRRTGARELRYVAIAESHQRKGARQGHARRRRERRGERRGAGAPARRDDQLADTGNLDFYQRCGYRLLSIERDYFTPARGLSTRLRAQRAPRRRHGLDGPGALMGTLKASRSMSPRCAESRDFRLLWAGDGITAAGSQLTRVAAAFQVYELTGSTLDGRAPRARDDGAAVLRVDPRRRSGGPLRAAPRHHPHPARRYCLRARSRR